MYGLDFLLEPECLDFKKPLPSSPPPTLAFFFHSSYIKAINCLLNIKFVQHQKRKLCKKILNNHVFNNAIVSYCSNPRTGVWYFLISLKSFVIWRACFLYQFVNHLISLIGETREATRKYHDWNLSVLLIAASSIVVNLNKEMENTFLVKQKWFKVQYLCCARWIFHRVVEYRMHINAKENPTMCFPLFLNVAFSSSIPAFHLY